MLATLYWDPNGATPGVGGSGTWDLSTPNWTTDPSGSSPTIAWTNNAADVAVFNTTPDSSGSVPASTVTIGSGIAVSQATFSSGAYTLQGGSLSVPSGLTIGVDAGGSATWTGAFSGAGSLVKTGPGTLTVSGSNTGLSGGARLEAGTLVVANNAALGSGTIQMAGGSLQASGARTLTNIIQAVTGTTSTLVSPSGSNLTLNGSITGSGGVATSQRRRNIFKGRINSIQLFCCGRLISMANSPDPRFRSAAIFAADGVTLKKVIQPKLKPLGWKSAGGWRGFEHRMFQLTPPPRDFTPWTNPGGMMGPVSIRTEASSPPACENTARQAIHFVGETRPALSRNGATLGLQAGCNLSVGKDDTDERYLTLSFHGDCRNVILPSAELLGPWLGSATCEYGVRYSECIPYGPWTIDELRSRLAELPQYSLELRGISSEQFAPACEAVGREVAGKVKWISHSVEIDHSQCGEIFPLVTERIPGYFFTAFFGNYAKGFDPYARPAAADAGETVRYPLVTCERPRLDKDGEKDLDIDIVHRPQGDCYFDIQALSFNPADDNVVRNTLAEAIALLDVKAEIWDGDPFLRWQ